MFKLIILLIKPKIIQNSYAILRLLLVEIGCKIIMTLTEIVFIYNSLRRIWCS